MTGSSSQGPTNHLQATTCQPTTGRSKPANADNLTQRPVYIFGNYIHDKANWDDLADNFHHDGIHCFGTASPPTRSTPPAGSSTTTCSEATPARTRQPGSTSRTAPTTPPPTTCSTTSSRTSPTTGATATSPSRRASTPVQSYNNTIIGTDASGSGFLLNTRESGVKDFENNLSINGLQPAAITTGGGTHHRRACPDFQRVRQHLRQRQRRLTAATFTCPPSATTHPPGSRRGSRAAAASLHSCAINNGGWTGGTGLCPGSPTSLKLNSDQSPQTGSPVLNAGTNLTSVCNSLPSTPVNASQALCTTYTGPPLNGTAGSTTTGTRIPPTSTGAWNVGSCHNGDHHHPISLRERQRLKHGTTHPHRSPPRQRGAVGVTGRYRQHHHRRHLAVVPRPRPPPGRPTSPPHPSPEREMVYAHVTPIADVRPERLEGGGRSFEAVQFTAVETRHRLRRPPSGRSLRHPARPPWRLTAWVRVRDSPLIAKSQL